MKLLRCFLDDPKLKRKHRKALARIERERVKVVKELEDAQRLTGADFAIRFNCRDTLLGAGGMMLP